ncbi:MULTISPECIES: hypothetical protein [unclassified Streptomyces]|uniref:hypothetical protein n=1 Tax=unclassified Streptomyces TaxID=2593676 RepID=UPI000C272347|nr:hypothetical protein [Streptomyces sp. CB02959]PJN33537.1 hypothetical protein CG747_41260 [Streptomyces sp. CB02959]
MARFVRWYGSGPLHLLVLLCSFALTAYAMVRLFAVRPLGVAIWFVGAAIVHDLILLPLYSVADLSAYSVLRHRPGRVPQMPWINYLRVPTFLSGVLLLVWFPLILDLAIPYRGDTRLPEGVYLSRWLAITGVLFGASALAFALKLRRASRAARADEKRPPPGPDGRP